MSLGFGAQRIFAVRVIYHNCIDVGVARGFFLNSDSVEGVLFHGGANCCGFCTGGGLRVATRMFVVRFTLDSCHSGLQESL